MLLPWSRFVFFALLTGLLLACGGDDDELTLEEAEDRQLLDPLPAGNVSASPSATGIAVRWERSPSDPLLDRYNIYRRPASDSKWTKVGEVEITGASQETYEFMDESAIQGVRYVYSVRAHTELDKESSLSESKPITVPP